MVNRSRRRVMIRPAPQDRLARGIAFAAMSLIMLVACAPALCEQQAADPPLPPHAAIVRAQVDHVEYREEPRQAHWAKFVVKHVYFGADEKMVGQTFELPSWEKFEPWVPSALLAPKFAEGEEVLLLINLPRPDIGFPEAKTVAEGRYGVTWPARRQTAGKGHTPYPQALKVAEFFEDVSKAKPTERYDVIAKRIAPENELLTTVAVDLLGKMPEGAERADARLDALASDPELPLRSQAKLDGVLVERRRAVWVGSEAQMAMFERWLADDPEDPSVGHAVYSRLRMAFHWPQVDHGKLLDMIAEIIADPERDMNYRVALIKKVGSAMALMDKPLLAYDLLMDRAANDNDPFIRKAAAHQLTRREPSMSPELLEKLNDPKTKSVVRRALDDDE